MIVVLLHLLKFLLAGPNDYLGKSRTVGNQTHVLRLPWLNADHWAVISIEQIFIFLWSFGLRAKRKSNIINEIFVLDLEASLLMF